MPKVYSLKSILSTVRFRLHEKQMSWSDTKKKKPLDALSQEFVKSNNIAVAVPELKPKTLGLFGAKDVPVLSSMIKAAVVKPMVAFLATVAKSLPNPDDHVQKAIELIA